VLEQLIVNRKFYQARFCNYSLDGKGKWSGRISVLFNIRPSPGRLRRIVINRFFVHFLSTKPSSSIPIPKTPTLMPFYWKFYRVLLAFHDRILKS
jgi:hypothetical protein